MLPYTPFTSEDLTSAATLGISDLSSVADLSAGLPSGKQIIFFSIGMLLTVAALALIISVLVSDSGFPELAEKLAPLAA